MTESVLEACQNLRRGSGEELKKAREEINSRNISQEEKDSMITKIDELEQMIWKAIDEAE